GPDVTFLLAEAVFEKHGLVVGDDLLLNSPQVPSHGPRDLLVRRVARAYGLVDLLVLRIESRRLRVQSVQLFFLVRAAEQRHLVILFHAERLSERLLLL